MLNAENTMGRVYEKWGSFKMNINYKEISVNNQKETTKILGTTWNKMACNEAKRSLWGKKQIT